MSQQSELIPCIYIIFLNVVIPTVLTFLDIDECFLGRDDCDDESLADCINYPGGFNCTCKTGYTGSGRNGTCEGKHCPYSLEIVN